MSDDGGVGRWGEFDDDAKFVCDRLKQAADDFTALGCWGWGAVITFATAVLLASAKERGEAFVSYSCDAAKADTNEIVRGFLYVIVIAAVAYSYFVWLAWRKVLKARTAVHELKTSRYSPALALAKRSAPTNWELAGAAFMRLLMFAVLFLIWWMVFDMTGELLQCLQRDSLGRLTGWLGRIL